MLKLSFYILLVFGLFIASCDDSETKEKNKIDKDILEEVLVQINKSNIAVEDRQIDDYLERRNWDFERTSTGLRYYVYQSGAGHQPYSGVSVVLEYEVSLIRGEVLYSSKTLGPKIFVVDKAEEPSGLQEAVKLLKVGDKAKIVVPSYLAYGLLGDDDKIPPKATLFYDVYLREIR